MKTIVRLFLLLLIALGLAKLALDTDSRRPWEGTYVPRAHEFKVDPAGARLVQSFEGVMGTLFVAEIEAPDEDSARRASEALWQRVWDLEQELSTWIPDSPMSRINREAASQAVPVAADTKWVLEEARSIWKVSDGAFDPTVGPLIRVWKPLATLAALPSDEEIEAARARVGFEQVTVDEGTTVSFTREGVTLDVGGVAKGYAAEAAAEAAMNAGATACRVNAGGDMFARGAPRADPRGFAVQIRDPDGGQEDSLPGIVVHLLNSAVATSGNYERYTEIDGRKYSHIVDPRTGRPVPDAIVQVTVFADGGAQADALATALCVLGVERGMKVLDRFKSASALFFIRREGRLVARGSPWLVDLYR